MAEVTLPAVIDYLEDTADESWLMGRCRSEDGSQNCVLGHLLDFGGGEAIDVFEEVYATSFMVFPVNDGEHPDYPQPTPKQRVLAYLRNMEAGREPTTLDHLRAYDEEIDRTQPISDSKSGEGK